jgi:hypothetical protein
MYFIKKIQPDVANAARELALHMSSPGEQEHTGKSDGMEQFLVIYKMRLLLPLNFEIHFFFEIKNDRWK